VNGWRWLWMEMIRANCSSNSDTDAVSWLRIVSMLCVSTVFAVARCLSVRRPSSVRLSVCPSVTLVHCIHMAEDIVKLLDGSVIILVFWPPAPIPNSNGNPFIRGAKCTWGGKILRFSTEIAVYLGNGTR